MKTRHVWILGCVVGTLIGCSGPVWIIPPGGNSQQFERESYECQRDAAMLPATPPPAPLPSTYTGTVYPGGYYTVTQQSNPAQGLQDLGTTFADIGQRQGLFERCMASKGYRKASAEERSAIDKRRAKTEELQYRGRVGLRVKPREEALFIVDIQPGGPAQRAGVRLGDRLTKVGGIPVDQKTKPDDLGDMLTGVPGSKVLVTLLRDGEEKEVVLTRDVLPSWGR